MNFEATARDSYNKFLLLSFLRFLLFIFAFFLFFFLFYFSSPLIAGRRKIASSPDKSTPGYPHVN